MKWLRRNDDDDHDTPCPESQKARQEAKQSVREAQAQWPAVREVSASLRRMQRRNNFGEAVERIMRGGNA